MVTDEGEDDRMAIKPTVADGVRHKAPWITPAVSKIAAGDAENGLNGSRPEGSFSYS